MLQTTLMSDNNGQFESFEDENRRLFDLLFRHQVYLEGVKAGFGGDYNIMLRKLYDKFAMFMGKSRYQTLDGYTKVELANFVRLFQLAQQDFFSYYTDTLIQKLKDFLAVDVDLSRGIFEDVTGNLPHEVDKPVGPTLGMSTVGGTDDSNAALWSRISNTFIPANGMTIAQSIAAFGNSTSTAVQNRLNIGYINKEDNTSVLAAIVGTSKNSFKDGLFARFNVQNTSLLATALQHISSIQVAAVGSVYYDRYQYVAILDNRTTEICQNLNGLVFTYGDGPLPPQHYNCRSKDVPIAGDQAVHDIPTNFSDWLATQPEDYLRDALGDDLANRVLDGSLPSSSFSSIGSVNPLTLKEFASKLPFILGE